MTDDDVPEASLMQFCSSSISEVPSHSLSKILSSARAFCPPQRNIMCIYLSLLLQVLLPTDYGISSEITPAFPMSSSTWISITADRALLRPVDARAIR